MQVRIVVVAGPVKGATFFLRDGENYLGRASGCDVVLPSPQVSKRHAMIRILGNKVEMTDAGSANGTFVNGVLAKKKLLQNGDKISLGPFVVELSIQRESRALVAAPSQQLQTNAGFSASDISAPPAEEMQLSEPEPKSLFAKMFRRFNEIVLPVIFEFNKTYDWLTVVTMMFVAFLVLNMGLTISPLIDAAKESVLRETESKARYISKQITHINENAVAEGAEGKLDVSFTEIEPSVQGAFIVNLEGRILAPGSRLNEVYNDPVFLRYRDRLKRGDQNLWKPAIVRGGENDAMITALDPIMVVSRSRGINVPGAVSVVKYSTSGTSLDAATISVVYFESFVISALVGAVFIYLLYQFAQNPIRTLNDDMDAVLKGNLDSVEKRFRFEVLNQLIDTVNAALSRIPRNDQSAVVAADTEEVQSSVESILRSTEALASRIRGGVMLLDNDRRIKFMNPYFEETTGIHMGTAAGSAIDNVCRDEALAGFMRDLIERAPSAGAEGVTEVFEFGSGAHKVTCTAVTGGVGRVDAYLILAEKEE